MFNDNDLHERYEFLKRALEIEKQLLPDAIAEKCISRYEKEIAKIEYEIGIRKHRDNLIDLVDIKTVQKTDNCRKVPRLPDKSPIPSMYDLLNKKEKNIK